MDIRVGQKLPQFRLATVGGTSRALSDFYGRPTLFVGWASWDPSRDLLAGLEEFYAEHSESFHLATIAFEAHAIDLVMRYLRPAGVTHTPLIDGTFHLSRVWGVKQLPFAVLADSEGYAQLVAEPGGPAFEKDVLKALKRKPERRQLRVQPERGPVVHPRVEILVQLCANYLTRKRVDDAVGFLKEAQELDPANTLLKRQALAIAHPDRFFDGAIDLKWLRGQEKPAKTPTRRKKRR